MKLTNARLFLGWCRARRFLFLYVALVFGFFFAVYGLYGYEWGVAGYAALLGLATGLLFAGVDFLRWAARARTLAKVAGRFPTAGLPEPADLLEEHWRAVVQALEAERGRLLSAGEEEKRDAQEYYTLWVHQIKTPIAAMRLLLQSAPQGSLGPAAADVEMELFRIEQYVGMVLQYQRLSSPRPAGARPRRARLAGCCGRATKCTRCGWRCPRFAPPGRRRRRAADPAACRTNPAFPRQSFPAR